MKDPNKIKRINFNVPLYLLKEIDELAKKNNETRTDILIEGAESIVEKRKRNIKLNQFLANRKPIINSKDNPEIFELGTNEWVRRLRQEWDIREEKIRKGKK